MNFNDLNDSWIRRLVLIAGEEATKSKKLRGELEKAVEENGSLWRQIDQLEEKIKLLESVDKPNS